ncbi:hypothetical protein JTB14_024520 [Gonioctena quinquepunctata]|nr:hypothetical protein JTB14_024520 [Gonioctena quinquepunctata]
MIGVIRISIKTIVRNKFSCDCRLDWVYTLHKKTSQVGVKHLLEELQCTMYTDKVILTPEIKENFVCPPTERSNEMDQDNMADEEEENGGKTYLMTFAEADLPCPPEYRPTPITVKQGTLAGTIHSASGSGRTDIYAVFIFVCLLFIIPAFLLIRIRFFIEINLCQSEFSFNWDSKANCPTDVGRCKKCHQSFCHFNITYLLKATVPDHLPGSK